MPEPFDLNVTDPRGPCVPLPVYVVIGCPECSRVPECLVCGGLFYVRIDAERLRIYTGRP